MNTEEFDIDKQLWIAKQKEIAEYEIVQRKKKRFWYWLRWKIIILLLIVCVICMYNCDMPVESDPTNILMEQKVY